MLFPASRSMARHFARSALMVIVPGMIGAQGVIVGRVTLQGDSAHANRPAFGALVELDVPRLGALTDSGGAFVLARVPSGERRLRVRLVRYAVATQTVRVADGDTLRLTFTLVPRTVQLAPLNVDASSVDRDMFESKPNVGTMAVSASQLSAAPRVGERDVIRVVQLLPGVGARNDFNTGLNVRGGESDQNLILLDGHPLYNPFHLGGLFSTFMDATVGGVELMTGAFPSRYGGRLSSVLDVKSAEDARPGLHGSADISALGATGRMTGLFGSGLGSWSVAARRTYADAATSVFTDNIFPYHFRDMQGHATYLVRPDLRVSLTGYVGRDILDADLAAFASDSSATRASEGKWAFNWGNRLAGVTIAKDFGARTTLEQRLSASGFSTVLDLGDGALSQRNSINDLHASGVLLRRGDAHDVSLGYEIDQHRLRYASASTQTGTTDFDIVQRPTAGALWIDDMWRASSRLLVETGLRADGLSSRQWVGVSPRLSVKYFLTPQLALTAAGGHVTQYLHSLAGDGPLRYFEIWLASDSFIPVASAWHGVLGAERLIGDAGSVKVEGYVKRYQRVMEANWSQDPQQRGDEFFAAAGVSYGVDMLARWQTARGLAGWLSYSYGFSSRWRDSLRWAPGHDRRHDVNLVATWRLRKYQVGSRFGFATGTPYTPIVGGVARRVYDPSLDAWGTGSPLIYIESIGGVRNSARFPFTHRIDLDVSREFHARHATWAPYLSVANAYNARNVFVYLYSYSSNPPTRRAISQFPVLPSLGMRVGF